MPVDWVVVGLDNGGTSNNGTILDSSGRFLLDRMAEVPSEVREGPDKAIQSLVVSVEQVLGLTDVPIMAVTAYSGVGDDERIRAAGAQAYVSKPISVVRFAETVEELLAGKTQMAQQAGEPQPI